ncbi:ethanolamine utilization protein EutH [Pontibacillus yanchengensis]|uniref:Ethanolamine utilization protein EutH n=2 Tax=Pontibacillus yanchengensis TaxID=462910 RepID=A0ACC7VL07_9BACI|nr:ethanolamine utilization protein EutH [Pontibacillus yanchengensis]MYL35786.1 ethanolamine utilization protein EutH [Pontibacillus yanchengensis]MYL55497.1 ethanolamine utilization protein EutH [Pontibacillus yanchengensis]
MWFNEGLLLVMCLFMVVGAVDHYVLHNRLSLGEHFHEAFMMMGPLALAMIGIISLAPVLSEFLAPVVVPIFEWVGADPSMFASMILAIDMGAYPLSNSLASSEDAAIFSWAFLGTMLGPTLVFTIPVALSVVQQEDRPFFAKGILIGVMTIPVGILIGGTVAGYEWLWMLKNLIPTFILSFFIAIGLLFFTNATIRFFSIFGKGIEYVVIFGLITITIQTLTDIEILQEMAPLSEGAIIVAKITVTLAGAYPLVAFINQKAQRRFARWGQKAGLNAASMTGLIASLAHAIPMLGTMKDMDERGKVMNAAFAVSGAFVAGSHLAFVAGVDKTMILPVIIGKLTAGGLAVIIALLLTRNLKYTD